MVGYWVTGPKRRGQRGDPPPRGIDAELAGKQMGPGKVQFQSKKPTLAKLAAQSLVVP